MYFIFFSFFKQIKVKNAVKPLLNQTNKGEIIMKKIKKMTEAAMEFNEMEKQELVEEIRANMAMEGCQLTEEDGNNVKRILDGEDPDQVINEIVENYKKEVSNHG